jgi:hypothetical protein
VSGAATIGTALTSFKIPATADIAYSFTIAATSTSDVATLTLSSGAVAQTTGTPTISPAGGGKNHEGGSLVTLVQVYAVLIECITEQICTLTASTWTPFKGVADQLESAGQRIFWMDEAGSTTLGTIVYNLDETGGLHRTTVIGQSS